MTNEPCLFYEKWSIYVMFSQKTLLGMVFCFLSLACATSPTGRKQLILVPESQMNQLGDQAFQEMKQTKPTINDPTLNQYIRCIIDPLTQMAGSSGDQWEVVIFKDDTANAFALPGKKIGVHTGILKVATTPSQLATVLGHEIGHVIAKHGAERVSQQVGTQAGLSALGTLTKNNPKHDLLLGTLGLGAQVGILLPFSRNQESEADQIGLNLMAEAGFVPQESVQLWKNMMAASGGKAPPQWLSTHPASENRISALEANMSNANEKFKQAKNANRNPQCKI